MAWSPQQTKALKEVEKWLKDPNGKQVFRLFGFAGTGKTSLARHLAEHVDGEVLFAAFTGKAAHVLRQKGCDNASTIHSLIYHSREASRKILLELESKMAEIISANPDNYEQHKDYGPLKLEIERTRKALAQPVFNLNVVSPVRYASLVIIDECSMVDARLGQDLLSFGTKVLVIGDPAQLPPVGDAGFFTHGHEPDVMLTEIHRQAADNPIIYMASQIRQETKLSIGNYGDSRVIDRDKLTQPDVLKADQLLVGRNKTRRSFNNRFRTIYGIEGWQPVNGDKLVCLRNNHELGLMNGSQWYAVDSCYGQGDLLELEVRSSLGGPSMVVNVHVAPFMGEDILIPWNERRSAEEFDFGYAMTTHKAQGSQWDDVIVYDESWCFRKDRWKWLYTAVTRAAETVTIVET